MGFKIPLWVSCSYLWVKDKEAAEELYFLVMGYLECVYLAKVLANSVNKAYKKSFNKLWKMILIDMDPLQLQKKQLKVWNEPINQNSQIRKLNAVYV